MGMHRSKTISTLLLWLAIMSAVLVSPPPARSETLKLMPNDQERLLKGEVLVNYKAVNDSTINLVQGQILYEAPAAVVWSALVDYPAYPRFFPDMNSITVVDNTAQAARIKVVTRNYWPYPDLRYTLRMTPNASSWTIAWKMEEGNLKTLYGTCKLFTMAGQPGKTVAVYSLVQDPGWMVPRFTSEMGNRSVVVERLLGLRQEVRSRSKQAGPEMKPQWRKALFWWEKQPEPDPTIEELFNPPFEPTEPARPKQ